MFTDIDVSGAHVLLCGDAARTERVGLKYHRAARVSSCSKLGSLALAENFSLAVICSEDAEEISRWRSALAKLPYPALVLVDEEPPVGEVGTVFLIGAGPSDPGLLTRHALDALSRSDVILLDHLAPHEGLERWAPHAEVIDVGKIPGKHRVPQREIDELMVSYARQGKNVARLKGGDPFVFGRGAEEQYVCEQKGIPVQVFSGVTSSIAVPAAADVPITLRRIAHKFLVASGHSAFSESDLDQFAAVVADGGTLSLLMSVRTLPATVEGLLARGVRADMPVATVQNGFRENQLTVYTDLEHAVEDLGQIRPPAVTVIGEVVAAAGPDRDAVMAEAFKTH